MHFFIDHTALTNQPSTEGFGPSFADPATKYDVSANFQLASEAKAFACQPGHIIVTDFFDVAANALDPALVNVILKPMEGLTVPFPTVKYYIYRGIMRDSFFTGSNFNAEGALSSCETVQNMWEDWHASTFDPLVPGDLGFDASLAGTVEIEEIFGNSRGPLRAREVKEGEWIGTFGSSKPICFEVITEAELLDSNLDYARKSKVQIDIGAMTAIPNPTPAQVHTLRCEKEKILAFVDPAALFGMHFSVGVSGSGLTTVPKRDTLVTTFLSHFSTATRVYVDIRSEKGYSYNFYDNYGGGGVSPNLISFKPGGATAFVDDPYLNQGWPLFSGAGWTGPDSTIRLSLRLRIDDNTRPLLFVEDASRLFGTTKNFMDEKELLNGAATDWSKAFNLGLDGSGLSTGPRVCVATHVRMQYLKQKAATVIDPRLLQFNHRLDTVFGGIDSPMLGSAVALGELRNEKVGLAEGADFAHVPDTGMYFDQDVVLLYGSSMVAYRTNNADPYPTTGFAASTLGNVVGSRVFPRDIVFSKWAITEGGTTIKLIDLSSYSEGTKKNTSRDGIHLLGLKRSELSRLQATTGFGLIHQRFLVFEEVVDQEGDDGFPYKKYEVKVQGLDTVGQRILVAPSPLVFVFGAGSNMFCSSDFSSFVNLPDRPPDPGPMKPCEFVFADTYQKGDPSVNAVEPTGMIEIDDLGNDNGITKPKVRLEGKYFVPIKNKGDQTPDPGKSSFPVVLIAHGNGHNFLEYDNLGQHLAKNGFIVAVVNLLQSPLYPLQPPLSGQPYPSPYTHYVVGSSPMLFYDDFANKVGVYNEQAHRINALPMTLGIDFKVNGGTEIEFLKGPQEILGLGSLGRANVILRHLQVLRHKFGNQVINSKIGLIGHSRGGEAVVCAARLIGASSVPPPDLRNIAAIISLAPSDNYEKENLTQDIPYFVLYGSQDTDVTGYAKKRRELERWVPDLPAGSGGFSLYDRARNGKVKSMAFVYGANHNGFITTGDRDELQHASTTSVKKVKFAYLADAAQKATAVAYLKAFLRQHLLGEAVWRSYFTGEFIPASTGTNKIYIQYKEMASGQLERLDDFEDFAVGNWAVSSAGKAVAHSRNGAGLDEGFLGPFSPTIDPSSPHETFGLKIAWTAGDTLTFTVDTAGKNVTAFSHLSFRITQVAGQVNSKIDDLKVRLEDTHSNSFPAPLGKTIPDPDHKLIAIIQPPLPPESFPLTKSAFLTVRIPLSTYTGVDLAKVKSVQFEFPTPGGGNIEIDDVEFTH